MSAQIKDIMTTQVLSVKDTDTLDMVADLFIKYDYDGLPVIDKDNTLIGIITAYDMVVQSSGMHLPTVLNIMEQISVNQQDRKVLEEHFEKLRKVQAKEIMNSDPLTAKADANVQDVAKEFAQHHKVNPIIVVDDSNKLVGVVSRYDIIRFFNEQYFSRMFQATSHSDNLHGLSRVNVEKEVSSAVNDLSKKFLLVGKHRPRLWKVVAIAMFIAGFIGAMAMVIRIVRNSEELNYVNMKMYSINFKAGYRL